MATPRLRHPSLVTSRKGLVLPTNPHFPVPTTVLISIPSRTLFVPDWGCTSMTVARRERFVTRKKILKSRQSTCSGKTKIVVASGCLICFGQHSWHWLTFNCSPNQPWELVRNADSQDPSPPYWIRACSSASSPVSLLYTTLGNSWARGERQGKDFEGAFQKGLLFMATWLEQATSLPGLIPQGW